MSMWARFSSRPCPYGEPEISRILLLEALSVIHVKAALVLFHPLHACNFLGYSMLDPTRP